MKIPGIGVEVNGATRWLGAGPLQFQPSELMKLALVLYAVHLLAERPQMVHDAQGDRQPAARRRRRARALLIASQPDLGTALVIGFTTGALLVAAGHADAAASATLGGAAVAARSCSSRCSSRYRRERLTSFLDPWAHAGDAGFQSVQGQIALGSGGLLRPRPRRVGAEDLLPARGAHGLHPRGDRRGARRRGRLRRCCSSTG